VQLDADGGVHDLFQEQGPHGTEQGGGFPGGVAGAGQPVEGEAIEEGHERLGRRLRIAGPQGAQHAGGQALEG
jgi:hypothetical protein